MTLRRLKLIVQYDGTPYCGWQYQPGQNSVQQTLEEALSRLTGHRVRVFAAGRTDTGVHAAAMPVHFETVLPIPAERLPFAMARFLPDSISVLSAEEVTGDFDARRSAIMRWYRYQVLMTPLRRPLGPLAWHVHRRLNLQAIEEGLAHLRGQHDFRGFRSSMCQASRTVLTMEQARLKREGELIAFDFKCRSFLHHMIRFMVGTMVAMGQGKLDPVRLRRILDDGERPQLILCAPPQGLSLMRVAYTDAERCAILEADPPLPSF